MESEILQLSGVVALFAFAIREFFTYIKSKKPNGGDLDNSKVDTSILNELQIMNSNHLHSIEDAIKDGNNRLVDIIHNDNTKIIEVLSEIKGHLQR